MCGITGYLLREGSEYVDRMERITHAMVDSLRHRGPDHKGQWADEEERVSLGHTRLSILDLSPAGLQPMVSQNGRFALTYNGEIYNYREIADRLDGEGIQFKGHSDTEVLLEAVSMWGIDATLRMSNGMFAFAIWDRQAKELVLARDRIGKKPLYYGWQNGNFFFTSELRALQHHPAYHAKINRNALASFFRYSYIPCPQSIYCDIQKLPQGSYVIINPAKKHTTSSRYWSIDQIPQGKDNSSPLTDEDAIGTCNTRIRNAVKRRLISDVSLGAFLSGGVDSSLVVSHMQAVSSQPAKTFTIGFHEEKFNEAPKAKAIARHLGTEHSEYYVSSDELIEYIPDLAKTYDEPFSDISQLPSFVVCKLARQAVTVCLSGDGGDEFFCGYDRYDSAMQKWSRLSKQPDWLRKMAAGTIAPIISLNQHNDQMRRLSRLLRCQSALDVFKLRSERLVNADTLVLGSNRSDGLHIDPTGFQCNDNQLEQMMRHDVEAWLADDILVKMDRASMANSLEIRNPLLDYEFASYALSLPLRFKQRDGVSKWLLKECLKQFVPEELTKGAKRGFSVPISGWLKGPLRDWAEELLSQSKISQAGYLNPKIVQSLWKSFLSGQNRYRSAVWSILMFQAWLEEHHQK